MPKSNSSRATNKITKVKNKINTLSPPRTPLKGKSRVEDAVSSMRNLSRAVKTISNRAEISKLNKEVKKLEAAVNETKTLKSTKRVMEGKSKPGDVYVAKQEALIRKANANKAATKSKSTKK